MVDIINIIIKMYIIYPWNVLRTSLRAFTQNGFVNTRMEVKRVINDSFRAKIILLFVEWRLITVPKFTMKKVHSI